MDRCPHCGEALERPPDSPLCGCVDYCGDLPEAEDHPKAHCRKLPRPPSPPLVTIATLLRGRASGTPRPHGSE